MPVHYYVHTKYTLLYTESDVNNSSYNVVIQPVDQARDLADVDIIALSEVMKEYHFKVDFDTAASGTKHINCCNKPMYSLFVLETVMEPHSYKYKQICKGSILNTVKM